MGYPEALLKWLLLVIISQGICPLKLAAQQGTAPPTANSAPTSTASQPDPPPPPLAPAIQPSAPPSVASPTANQRSQKSSTGTSRDRLFFTLPNFLTVEDAKQAKPLTPGEKFELTARSSFDWATFLWYGAVAGVSQAENQEAGYGQGAEGYAKRYGAHFADGTIENFMTAAILPSLLHQDPRYYQLGKGGFWHRSGYAVSRIFVTRTDRGNPQTNYSEILGAGAASAISTYAYYPQANRNPSNVMSLWGTQLGYDALSNVLKEFWPDIRRKLHHPKPAQSP
jgi:hypothetical protein